MNREILFKAKRKDNGEWVEGLYAYISNPLTENGEPIKHLICNGTNIFNYEINRDTLCEFTELTDKNVNKIWENDICIIKDGTLDEEDGCFICKWDDCAARYILDGSGLAVDFDNVDARDIEVIGNVFDNADLLEVE